MTWSPSSSGTSWCSSDRQSRNSAWSARPMREMNWSMIPHFIPTNSFSASWQRRARRGPWRSNPSSARATSAVATSSAADEERPAPLGDVPAEGQVHPGERHAGPRQRPEHAADVVAPGVGRDPARWAGPTRKVTVSPEVDRVEADLAARRGGARPSRWRTPGPWGARTRRCSRCARRSGSRGPGARRVTTGRASPNCFTEDVMHRWLRSHQRGQRLAALPSRRPGPRRRARRAAARRRSPRPACP